MSVPKVGGSGRRIVGRPFTKGGPGTGRKPGQRNKFSTLKASFLEAFESLGSTQGLLTWARTSAKNRELFYSWLSRMLPHELSVPAEGGDITVIISEGYKPKGLPLPAGTKRV
jgi:hypothetical protein